MLFFYDADKAELQCHQFEQADAAREKAAKETPATAEGLHNRL